MALERIHPSKLRFFDDLSMLLRGRVIIDGFFDENDILKIRWIYVDRDYCRDECWIWDSETGKKISVDCEYLRMIMDEFVHKVSSWENYRRIEVEA